MPKPTELQLRQHALDRAVTDGIVHAVGQEIIDYLDPSQGVDGGTLYAEALAKAVTKAADVFVEYLRGPAEEPAFKVTDTLEANLGLATTRELLEEIRARLDTIGKQSVGNDLVAWSTDLTEADLNYRTADTAGALHHTPEV
jgi:hypothetical protein